MVNSKSTESLPSGRGWSVRDSWKESSGSAVMGRMYAKSGRRVKRIMGRPSTPSEGSRGKMRNTSPVCEGHPPPRLYFRGYYPTFNPRKRRDLHAYPEFLAHQSSDSFIFLRPHSSRIPSSSSST